MPVTIESCACETGFFTVPDDQYTNSILYYQRYIVDYMKAHSKKTIKRESRERLWGETCTLEGSDTAFFPVLLDLYRIHRLPVEPATGACSTSSTRVQHDGAGYCGAHSWE